MYLLIGKESSSFAPGKEKQLFMWNCLVCLLKDMWYYTGVTNLLQNRKKVPKQPYIPEIFFNIHITCISTSTRFMLLSIETPTPQFPGKGGGFDRHLAQHAWKKDSQLVIGKGKK